MKVCVHITKFYSLLHTLLVCVYNHSTCILNLGAQIQSRKRVPWLDFCPVSSFIFFIFWTWRGCSGIFLTTPCIPFFPLCPDATFPNSGLHREGHGTRSLDWTILGVILVWVAEKRHFWVMRHHKAEFLTRRGFHSLLRTNKFHCYNNN